MKNISIKWQILISFFFFIAGLLMLIWIFQIVFLDNFYKSIRQSEVEDVCDIIESKLGKEDWTKDLSQLASDSQMNIIIVKANGENIFLQQGGNNPTSIDIYQTGIIKLIDEVNAMGGELTFDTQALVDKGLNLVFPHAEFIMKVKNTYKGGEKLTILINANLLPVNSTVQTLSKQLFVISFIMIISASSIAFILSKKISTPIINLNRKSRYLASGNYNIEFLESGYQEIEELSETLNYASREMAKIDNLQKELISNVSHDLKTPLTMIQGYAEMMRDFKDEMTEENMNVIIEETRHLTNLVNNILDLSKIQAGSNVNNMEEFSLTEEIKSTINRFNHLLEAKNYLIDFEYDDDIYINSDKSKILQVVYNLLNNAINYIGTDGKVVIRQTKIENHKVKVEIIDHGIGIPADKLADIWDRYYKVDKTHKRSNTGFGLGLSMVKAILNSLNCEFGVESELGKGSNFYFILEVI